MSLLCKNPSILPDNTRLSLVLPKSAEYVVLPTSTPATAPAAGNEKSGQSVIESKIIREALDVINSFRNQNILTAQQVDSLLALQQSNR